MAEELTIGARNAAKIDIAVVGALPAWSFQASYDDGVCDLLGNVDEAALGFVAHRPEWKARKRISVSCDDGG